MDCIEALILGIVQGFTEFLPVSSSGHLAIGAAILGVPVSNNLTFAVVVHTATVLSTIIVLRREILQLLQGLFRFTWNKETRFISQLLLSAVPVGIVGICWKDKVEEIFSGGLTIVGAMLLLTAALLAFAYYARSRQKENMTLMDAFIIGLAQACAVMPGLSRSGTTISAGILLGNRRETVARFSFLMVLVPVLGQCCLDIMSGGFSFEKSGIPVLSLLMGFIAAFVSGFIACSWMLDIVKKGKFIWFAVYCAIAGTAVLIFS
ncbi:MAG: undecaprenyl-diphosphate phosphatase [Bacteroidales bacterium]|jgi:undecaprenyl-diphosphatase|nr:undecaprenyl-diphosphate phosphatase [Bacteroidales bacterium]